MTIKAEQDLLKLIHEVERGCTCERVMIYAPLNTFDNPSFEELTLLGNFNGRVGKFKSYSVIETDRVEMIYIVPLQKE